VQADIVSQTSIRFHNCELLQLMYDHLIWSGLHTSAATLAREASLKTPTTTTTAVFTTPKSALRNVSADGQLRLRVTWNITLKCDFAVFVPFFACEVNLHFVTTLHRTDSDRFLIL